MLNEQTNRRKRFQRDRSVTMQITERDTDIIKLVYKNRFLNSDHITNLIGDSRRVILKRLNLLYHTGFLDRPASSA